MKKTIVNILLWLAGRFLAAACYCKHKWKLEDKKDDPPPPSVGGGAPVAFLAVVAWLLLAGSASAEFVVTGPTHDGEEITVDLPTSEHMRNSGGNDRTPQNPMGLPGRGSGLCVFTSAEMAARWANLQLMRGFQKWMENKPGGGYPEKFAQMMSEYCRSKGQPEPAYIQHTGGDIAFLKATLATRRMVCVTYDGRDGKFYQGQIAHMVNLVHFSEKWAVILDNNNPGKYLWMSPAEFLSRWKGNGGGWAITFLDDPAAPIPTATVVASTCPCGDDCGPGCECGCHPRKPRQVFGQCSGGQCSPSFAPVSMPTPVYPAPLESRSLIANGDGHRIRWADDPDWPGWRKATVNGIERGYLNPSTGEWYDSYTRVTERLLAAAERKPFGDNFGIDVERLSTIKQYTRNGKEITKQEAIQAIGGHGLDNDAALPWVVAVGDQSFQTRFRAVWASVPAEVRSKFNLQVYGPDHWGASGVGYAPGITCTRADNGTGKAVVQWRFREMPTAEQLAESLRRADPNYKPDADPDPLKKPAPKAPDGNPINPNTPAVPSIPIVWVLIAGGVVYLLTRKKGE